MHFFGHPDSGHAYKVALLLSVGEIEHDYTLIDIFSPRESRPAKFQQHASFGEVPLLVDAGVAYTQSNAILMHLAQKFRRWGGEDAHALQHALEWLFWEANKIGMCLPQLRADQLFDDSRLQPDARAWLSARYTSDVGVLDARLGKTGAFVVGDTPTIADFSICGYLFLADEAQVNVPGNVRDWLERLRQLPNWRAPRELLDR
ncbi:MAG: glutathione S-transferase family protein [Pseudomonadota bacterium]